MRRNLIGGHWVEGARTQPNRRTHRDEFWALPRTWLPCGTTKKKRSQHVPFGGRKASSYGPREQGQYAVEFYTTVKTSYTFAG